MQIGVFTSGIIASLLIITNSFFYTFEDRDITNPVFLVNSDYMIASSYVPEIAKANISGTEKYLRYDAIQNAQNMFEAAKKDGISLNSFSSYRTHAKQNLIFARKLQKNNGDEQAAKEYVNPPGASEHQLGLAIDIVGYIQRLNDEFADTPQGKWLEDNSYKYGFVIRYKHEHIQTTKIAFEPWHIRYVGIPAAKIMHDKNIPLEKYVSQLRLKKYKELLNIR